VLTLAMALLATVALIVGSFMFFGG